MKILRLAFAFTLALFATAAAFAQPPIDGKRAANRDALIKLMAEFISEPEVMTKRTDEFLGTLTQEDALAAQADMLQLARQTGLINRLEYARYMLRLNEREAPDDERTLDYWRYVVMLAARVERGQMEIEEYHYLMGRKLAEVRRAQGLEQRDAEEADRQASAAAAYQEQQRQAQADASVSAALRAIGSVLRGSPATSTRCIRVGIELRCTAR